jgi:hypothetical protein
LGTDSFDVGLPANEQGQHTWQDAPTEKYLK